MISNSKDYEKKLILLKKYDKFYFENNKPLISDAEYDNLKQ